MSKNRLKLAFNVNRAIGLIPKDGKGSCSAYVEVYFDGMMCRTSLVENDLNPVWNETFYFEIDDPLTLPSLFVDAYIYHHLPRGDASRVFLGKVSIRGTRLVPAHETLEWYHPLEKISIFSRVGGMLGSKVYITDDPMIKPSAVEYVPIPYSTSWIYCCMRRDDHPPDAIVFNCRKREFDDSKPEPHIAKLVPMPQESAPKPIKHTLETAIDGAIKILKTINDHDEEKHADSPGLIIPNDQNHRQQPRSPKLVRAYTIFSSLPAEDEVEQTSLLLPIQNRTPQFFDARSELLPLLEAVEDKPEPEKTPLLEVEKVQLWTKITRIIFFIYEGILLPILMWLGVLVFRLCNLNLRRGSQEEQEIPNMIKLNLTIDVERNRVLYAESDKDFVDILFSFLTLPMGTIIRLSEEKSGIGSMDNLYSSVESLDEKFLQTKACKNMLLNPRNASGFLCDKLAIKIDDTDIEKHYVCSKIFCSAKEQIIHDPQSFRLASAFKDSQCVCGELMDKGVFLKYNRGAMTDGNGVFLKETQSFIITDDLRVVLVTSMSDCLEVVKTLRIGHGNSIEQRVVTLGTEDVLELLKNSFHSSTPMSNTFISTQQAVNHRNNPLFQTQGKPGNSRNVLANSIMIPGDRDVTMKVKLLIDKSKNQVLCLEAKEDFLDNMLSFLSFPLGYMLKVLSRQHGSSSLGNLRKSVGKLDERYFHEPHYRDMLLNQNLAPYSSVGNQVLGVWEEATHELLTWCRGLTSPEIPSGHSYGTIMACSPTTGMLDLFRNNVSMSDTEIREIDIGREEILAILVASLTTKRVLNSIFG